MPIIDHVEKIVAPNSTGVTIPYAYNAGALNRYVLVLGMACHPSNTLAINPLSGATYGGLELSSQLTGRSIVEAGDTIAWCSAFARSLLLGEQPLSGDVAISLSSPQNLVAYVIGFRGVGSFPYYWDRLAQNHVPDTGLTLVLNNPYLGIAGFAIKAEATITTVSGAAEILEQETIADGVGSITGSLVLTPQGQNLLTGFLSGNAGYGAIGWVPYADMDQGEDVLPAPPPPLERRPLSPYVRHELFWRGRVGKPLP